MDSEPSIPLPDNACARIAVLEWELNRLKTQLGTAKSINEYLLQQLLLLNQVSTNGEKSNFAGLTENGDFHTHKPNTDRNTDSRVAQQGPLDTANLLDEDVIHHAQGSIINGSRTIPASTTRDPNLRPPTPTFNRRFQRTQKLTSHDPDFGSYTHDLTHHNVETPHPQTKDRTSLQNSVTQSSYSPAEKHQVHFHDPSQASQAREPNRQRRQYADLPYRDGRSTSTQNKRSTFIPTGPPSFSHGYVLDKPKQRVVAKLDYGEAEAVQDRNVGDSDPGEATFKSKNELPSKRAPEGDDEERKKPVANDPFKKLLQPATNPEAPSTCKTAKPVDSADLGKKPNTPEHTSELVPAAVDAKPSQFHAAEPSRDITSAVDTTTKYVGGTSLAEPAPEAQPERSRSTSLESGEIPPSPEHKANMPTEPAMDPPKSSSTEVINTKPSRALTTERTEETANAKSPAPLPTSGSTETFKTDPPSSCPKTPRALRSNYAAPARHHGPIFRRAAPLDYSDLDGPDSDPDAVKYNDVGQDREETHESDDYERDVPKRIQSIGTESVELDY